MRQHGFTVMESLVVIGLVGFLSVATLTGYRLHSHQIKEQKTRIDVQILMQALNHYYQAHCTKTTKPTVSVEQLYKSGLLPNRHMQYTQFGTQYTVDVLWSSHPVTLYVSVPMPVDKTDIMRYLNPAGIINNSAYFIEIADRSGVISEETAVFLQMYEPDCI